MFVAPRYDEGTLADVLPGALAALGVPGIADRLGLAARLDGVRRVAVLLVDGMGWHQLPAMAPVAPVVAATLRGELGSALSTTCGFPSTTPTSLVGLATGALPGTHGVLAFNTIVPGTDRVLNHTVWADDPPPRQWVPVPPLYAAAAAAGISTTVVNRPEYAGSGLTTATSAGARYLPAVDTDELATGMLTALKEAPARALVYGYHPRLDKAGHQHGLTSAEWAAAAAEVDALLARLVAGLPEDAALLVTADHGQLDVPADRRVDVHADPALSAGVRVVTGEPRVRYLHTAPGATADVLAAWRERAGHVAWLGTRDEAIATGWYGPMGERHAARLGDVVAVCRDDWAILATATDPPSVARLVAMHGSLTEPEMRIPLFTYRP
ncbi:alkaline phosphatase family protein [Catellatospora coxensis]|uniref:Alkaline phosphatase family protein n=1 Tax=Catellatospora coxensis TaxID=310354 RepID=A0A8J3KU68_9ACTN|nr:nucleotide pyrophosphatase/phosphodiesterase family protein [Catellatospora coxensis]GIG03504.1 alkaline phosphatase family protein [Catellatospora coxensis]